MLPTRPKKLFYTILSKILSLRFKYVSLYQVINHLTKIDREEQVDNFHLKVFGFQTGLQDQQIFLQSFVKDLMDIVENLNMTLIYHLNKLFSL